MARKRKKMKNGYWTPQKSLMLLLGLSLVGLGIYFVYSSRATGTPISTSQCLARPSSQKTTLNSSYSSQFKDDSGRNDWTFDARNTASTAYPNNSLYPFTVGKTTAPLHGCWVGGKVVGTQSRSLTWQEMKTSYDGSALRMAGNDWYVVDGLRADNVEDGIDPRGRDGYESDPTQGNGFNLRNAYMTYIRDDCVENDNYATGLIYDSLFDGCYTGISEQASTGIVNSPADETFVLDHVLLRLQAMPGPYGCETDGTCGTPGYGKLFKWYPGANKLIVRDSIILVETAPRSASKLDFPDGAEAQNVKIVWLGGGSYPGSYPNGVTVTTNRSVWDNAKTDWLNRHGCTSFDNCTKLTNPDPIGGPQPDTTPPTAPTNLTATTISSSQINLSWGESYDERDVPTYDIYRGTSAGTLSFVTSSANLSYQDLGLNAQTTYYYQVKAKDNAGNISSPSNTANATTREGTPPSAPENLRTTNVAYNRVDLAWNASTDNVGVAGYRLYRDGVLKASPTVTNYSDTTVLSETSYNYYVVAYDAAGNVSPQSNSVPVTTPQSPDTTAPSRPTNVAGTAVSHTQINLTWTASTDDRGVIGYEVSRGLSSTSLSVVVPLVAATNYSDTGLNSYTTYYYYVKAKDAAGNLSQPSTPTISVRTLDGTPPSIPSNVHKTTSTTNSISLAWTASTDNSGTVGGYKIFRASSQTGELEFLATVPHAPNSNNEINFTDNLVGATSNGWATFWYAVSAYDTATPANESALSPRYQTNTCVAVLGTCLFR